MSRLRSVLSLEREYQLRSVVAPRPGDGQPIVHVASWKTASQWTRILFSDPQLMRAAGYRPTYVRGRTGASGLNAELFRSGRLLTPVYASANHPLLASGARVFVVVRDPVSLARSWFDANALGHPTNPDVNRRRQLLQELQASNATPAELMRASLDDGFEETLHIGASWISRAVDDPSVHVVDFSLLTAAQTQEPTVRAIFRHIGFGNHEHLVPKLLGRYNKRSLARLERLVRPPAERKYDDRTVAPAHRASIADEQISELLQSFGSRLLEPYATLEPKRLVS